MDYTGYCPICGARDCMIIHGADNKYRVMCRNISCPGFYKPAPRCGLPTKEEAIDGSTPVDVYQYLFGGDND